MKVYLKNIPLNIYRERTDTMMWHTHLAFGLLFGILAMQYFNHGNAAIFLFFVLVGSLIPDVDSKESKINQKLGITKVFAAMGHRGICHTIWFAAIIGGGVYLLWSKVIGTALFIGMFSHLFADSLTMAGVDYLHPFATWHHRGFIQTGKIGETIVLVMVLLLTVWVVFF